MRALRVYVETSVIGGCCDPEFATWSKGLLEDFAAGIFRPVVSELVAAEVADAPREVLEKYAELLRCDPEQVETTPDAEVLADAYLRRGILPESFRDDALHVALATVAEVDVIVSWNFRHVVRLEKIRLFNAVNLELGYKQIEIYSPREVARHGDQGG